MSEHEDPKPNPEPTPAAPIETPAEETPQPAAPESQPAAEPMLLEAPPEALSSAPHPRSLKRRLEQQQVDERKTRVRSQPINPPTPKRVREPVVLDWEPEPMSGPWRAKPLVVGLAILGWVAAIALLMTAPDRTQATGLSQLLVPLIWAAAAATTFVPIQLRLALPGIGWQSMVGFGLLGYILAFVPAPSGWLLDLPDLPVYLLLFLAIFYAVSAAIVPLIYLLGQRYYKLRIHRLDVGRARRQAYEIGLLIVVSLVMAGLRVLSPVTFGLLALVIVLTEALLLSQVQPEG
ncbi:MAG TPA: hypothetical protein VGD69_22535 [Herpetosiphonaceae bacterium]